MPRAALLAVVFGLALTRCGANSGSSVDAPDVAAEIPDVAPPEADLLPDLDAAPDALPAGHLEFVDAFGDDQQPCAGADTCTVIVTPGESRALAVRWVPDAGGAGNVAVGFSFVDDPQGRASLATSTVYTDATGRAATSLKVALDLGCYQPELAVRACVQGLADACLTFRVRIEPKADYLLAVGFSYDGDQAFYGVTVYLFESASPDAADLLCSDLDPLALPMPSFQIGPVALSQVAKLACIPGIEDGTRRFYTIVAVGERIDGSIVTFGCNDTEGAVDPVMAPPQVTVVLDDVTEPCPPWAPVIPLDGTGCVGCTNDTHCPCGSCTVSGICVTSGEASCACSEPYPACVNVEGQVICVDCYGDDMCPTGCECTEHTCLHPDGSWCPRPLSGCKDPCATAGCPDPEHRWISLTCDVEAQCCFAANEEGCDDLYAFCTHPGSSCLHVGDIFGASFATWLNGDAACEPGARGFCTCDLTTRELCAAGDPASLPGCCPAGQVCLAGDELFRRLASDPAAEPPLDVHHRGFCVAAPGR